MGQPSNWWLAKGWVILKKKNCWTTSTKVFVVSSHTGWWTKKLAVFRNVWITSHKSELQKEFTPRLHSFIVHLSFLPFDPLRVARFTSVLQ